MSGYFVGTEYDDGRLVRVVSSECPRLLDEACGCTRKKGARWTLFPCPRHADEIARCGLGVIGL
jgi:hypothetical protein